MPRHPSSLKIDAFLYFSPKWPSVGTLHLLAYTISCSIQYKSKSNYLPFKERKFVKAIPFDGIYGCLFPNYNDEHVSLIVCACKYQG